MQIPGPIIAQKKRKSKAFPLFCGMIQYCSIFLVLFDEKAVIRYPHTGALPKLVGIPCKMLLGEFRNHAGQGKQGNKVRDGHQAVEGIG